MKKVAAFVFAVMFMLTVVPCFAADTAAPAKEQNLFKIICNSIKPWNPKPKNTLKPLEPLQPVELKKVDVFQNLANGINEGSKKAKAETLRTK